MLIDLLSPSNQISFNIQAAKIFGLDAAVYLSELISINEKAIRKNKIEHNRNNDYFTVDREYITGRTTITEFQQKEIDKRLKEVKVISIDSNDINKISLDLNMFANAIGGAIGDDSVEKIASLARKKTKEEKRNSDKNHFRYMAQTKVTTKNPDLRTAYYKWIDACIEKHNYISTEAVVQAQNLVSSYAPNDVQAQITIVTYAATRAWVDMKWSIKNCSESGATQFNMTGRSVRDNTIYTSDTKGEVF